MLGTPKIRLPTVQRRLIQRISTAHDDILEALCDAPPARPVQVGWHDQLADGRRSAGEVAESPAPFVPDDPQEEPQSSELVLAARLRKALWTHARGRKATRNKTADPASRADERAKALKALQGIRFNAQSIRAMSVVLLGHARPLRVAGELPDIPEKTPALADAITTETGMQISELRDCADRIDKALAKAMHNMRLLVESSMPMVAEVTVALGMRGKGFLDGIEQGRAALLHTADRFCFAGESDFLVAAEKTVSAALSNPDRDTVFAGRHDSADQDEETPG